jgi:hypothetical protein
MVMNSHQIASMTGGFNQQVMMGMQHSAMISQMYGGYAPNPNVHPVPTQGQQFAGMGMAAMGQMGMNALGSQRLNNFGGGVMQPLTQTGSYMLGQMQYGAGQQMMLDANMRQSYRHMNEFGGRGFTANQMRGIGQDLRQMSLERGPQGEQTTFEELGRLASNMGRMGMAEGVRSVKDFNEKFQTMLKSVKTIATELGTSLEEAQKVMASMKGSGIFRGQAGIAGKIRAGALAGNMATEEMTGAMLIGSQISRSVGGLGSAGAQAGLEAMTQVGAARQAGVINEEDIYNATGLTGAAGRRAFMQQGLSRQARFYKSRLGERMLASIAGEDGTIDEGSLQELLAGGGGTAGTMRRAKRNLAKIGRADFVRNEGRLRGAAMQELGMMGDAIQFRDWMEDRGLDFDDLNDRNMLFYQRKSGLGRDEADAVVKMARGLDRMGIQRQRAQQQDEYQREIEMSRRRQSPQELIKELEMGRAGVQNQLRQAGADLYGDLSVATGEMMGRMSGGYFDRRRTDLTSEINIAHRGGRAGRRMLEREFGINLSGEDRRIGGARGRAAQRELYGEAGMNQAQFNRFLGGQADAIRGAGYELSDIESQADYAMVVQESSARARGFAEGGSSIVRGRSLEDLRERSPLDDATRQQLRDQLMAGGAQGKEKEFLNNLEKTLERVNTEQGKSIAKEFKKATEEDRARMAKDILAMTGMEHIGAGRFGGAGQFASMPIASGRFATQAAEDRAVGRGLTTGLSRQAFQSYEEGADQFLERSQYVLGGEETGAGRALSRVRGFSGDILGRVDRFRRDIREDREEIAGRVGRAPRDALKGALRFGGGALDWSTGGLTRGLAEGVFGEGGVTGKGGVIDRAAGATGYDEQVEGALAGWTRERLGGYGSKSEQAVGEYMRSKEGQDIVKGVFSADEEVRKQTIEQNEKRRAELSNKARNAAEEAELVALQGVAATRLMGELGEDATEEDLQGIADRIYGKGKAGLDTLRQARRTTEAGYNQMMDDRTRQFYGETGRRARKALEAQSRRDVDLDKLVKDEKITGTAADFVRSMQAERGMRAMITGVEGMEAADKANLAAAQGMTEQLEEQWLTADRKTREEIAKGLSTAGETNLAARKRRELSLEDRLKRSGPIGGDKEARTIAGALGASFKKGDLGQGAGTDAQAIVKDLGLDLLKGGKGAEIEKELTAILKGEVTEGTTRGGEEVTRKLTREERASRLADLQESGKLQEAQKAKQDATARQNDPMYRELQQTTQAIKDIKDGEISNKLGEVVGHLKEMGGKLE